MSWAEFQIRLEGFKRRREYEASLTREISYEVHRLNYIFGKKSPPSKQAFWAIGEQKQKGVSDALKNLFRNKKKEYLKQKDG